MKRRGYGLIALAATVSLLGVAVVAPGISSTGDSPPATPSTDSSVQVDVPSFDWSADHLQAPTGSQLRVAQTAADATQLVPFATVATPDTLGTPSRVIAVGADADPEQQAILYRFDTGAGPLEIVEHRFGFTQEGIDTWAQPGYCSNCTLDNAVGLAGGERGVLLSAPDQTISVSWIQNGVQIDARGDPALMSAEALLKYINPMTL